MSGRPIADLDRLFAPLKLPAVGGHGAETRLRDETFSTPNFCRRPAAAACRSPRIRSRHCVEDKGYSLALHYRNAPQREERLRAAYRHVRAAFPQEAIEVLPGKAMFEVKRPGVSKGEAVRALMTHAPFAGRRPVFIGDDVTDKSVFAMLAGLAAPVFRCTAFPGFTGIFEFPPISAAPAHAGRAGKLARARVSACERELPRRSGVICTVMQLRRFTDLPELPMEANC